MSSQEVQISAKLRLWLKFPLAAPLSWEIKSTSKKLGTFSSQLAKILTGIFFFSKVFDLVIDLPFILYFFLVSTNILSIVATLIFKSFSLTLVSSFIFHIFLIPDD